MAAYKTNIRLANAAEQDYQRLDKEMERELFDKLRCSEVSVKQLAELGREYSYRGGGSLQEITAAAYRAAHNTGKEYRFTIVKQRGA
ncbi:MAG TPA: hypothetical protein VGS79_08645 [Puia sp.]|nr:hypothetical protein [Puia sp.]